MEYKKRTRNFYDPRAQTPFNISRSKIDLFLECPLCFYLDRRLGVGRPSMPAFTLNVAVDRLLKKEFDIYRAKKETHPLMKRYKISAVPFAHADLDLWRENFTGVRFCHPETNLTISGAVDDVWMDESGELAVVDYKATAKDGEVELTDSEWHRGYKRQLEVYQWLLRKNEHRVSDTGYFVYVNGKADRASFDGKLEFDVKVIPYTGSDKWVEKTLIELKKCLDLPAPPEAARACEFCGYRTAMNETITQNTASKNNRTLFG